MYATSTTLNRWLAEGSFRRDATLLFTSTALARGILVLSMPLLARFFAPADVGNWQLFVSGATVLATIICWRYEVAIPLPADEEKSRDLFGACLLLSAVTSALLVLPILLFRERFAVLVGAAAIEPYLWCIPLFTLLAGCEQASTFWLTRTGDFKKIGLSRVVKSALMVAVPLAAALALEVDFGALVAGTMLGQLAATIYLLREDESRGDLVRLGTARWPRFLQVMLEYRNYPLYVAPYAFVGQFSKRLVYFLLAAFASATTVGYFAMAMQLTYVPVTFVTAALNQAFYRRAAGRDDLRQLEPLVLKVLTLQVILAVPFFVLLVLHGEFVIRLALGPDWQEAASYVKWLAAPSLMLFFTAWLDRLFDALGRQRLAVALQLAYDALSIGLLFALLAAGYSSLVAIASYAVVTSLYNVVWLAITFRIARFSLIRLSRQLLFATGLVAAMLVTHGLATHWLNQSSALFFEAAAALTIQAAAFRSVGGLRV